MMFVALLRSRFSSHDLAPSFVAGFFIACAHRLSVWAAA